MRIQIASDLHLEFIENRWPGYRHIEPADGIDVLVVAGDIHQGTRGFGAFEDLGIPIIYVAGNHEFYKHTYETLLEELRNLNMPAHEEKQECKGNTGNTGEHLNTHFLEQEVCVLGTGADRVRFLGTTLWTDYALDGNPAAAMDAANWALNDHRLIRVVGKKSFKPVHALAAHRRARAWLEQKLSEPFDGKTVVVTHHGPHPKSVHPQYVGDALNPAFTSDLTDLMGKARLWIHGHTHASVDYEVNGTRVVANPAGYPVGGRQNMRLPVENSQFDPRLVIEI